MRSPWRPSRRAHSSRTSAITRPLSIVNRDLETGQETTLYRWVQGDLRPFFALSPDGRDLAFKAGPARGPKVLKLISTDGGEPRHLADLVYQDKHILIRGMDSLVWTPDGRYLLFNGVVRIDGQRSGRLWRVPKEGGAPRLALNFGQSAGKHLWGEKTLRDLEGLQFRPDGRQFGFWAHTARISPNAVWVLENFLPQPVTPR